MFALDPHASSTSAEALGQCASSSIASCSDARSRSKRSCRLTAGLVAAALVCADALGPNGPLVLSVALLITVVVLFATTGFGRLAIAAVCAFAAVAASYWLGLDLLVLLLAFFERAIAQASHWMQLVVLELGG